MTKKRFGDLVKEERQRRELSQYSLAERAGISIRTLSDIETYKANPSFETVCSLAQCLNISLDTVILNNLTSSDGTRRQIYSEIEQCDEKDQIVILDALRGVISGLHKQRKHQITE